MTPEQKIKWMILAKDYEWRNETLPEINADNIDDLYQELVDNDAHWDARSEVRNGDVETNLESEYSRHYESKAVASQAPDGSWVGWTYWYGGGKHSDSESIEWMSKAYDLDCVEELVTITKRTFARKEVAR